MSNNTFVSYLFIVTMYLIPTLTVTYALSYDGWIKHSSPSFPRDLAHNAIGIDPSNNTIWLLGESITDYGANRLETNVFGETHYYAQIGSILFIGDYSNSYLNTFDVTTAIFVSNSVSPPLSFSSTYSCLVSIRNQYLALLQNDGIVQILDTHSPQHWLSNVSSLFIGRRISSCAY
eukprot:393315_1